MSSDERSKAKAGGLLKNIEGRMPKEFPTLSFAEKLAVIKAVILMPMAGTDFAPFKGYAESCQQEVLSFGLLKANLLTQVLKFDAAVLKASEGGTLSDYEFIYKSHEWTKRVVLSAISSPEILLQSTPKLVSRLLHSLSQWHSPQTSDMANKLYTALQKAFLQLPETAQPPSLTTFFRNTQSLDQSDATDQLNALLADPLAGKAHEDLMLEFNNPL
jgi:hypothetical protein